MFVRSGVSKIRLVDFDNDTLSLFNRHATASLTNLGAPKIKCIERTRKPWEDSGALLEGVNWVMGAHPTRPFSNERLTTYCHEYKIKVFTSMGAAAKCDSRRNIGVRPLSRALCASKAPPPHPRHPPHRLGGLGDVKLLSLPEDELQNARRNSLPLPSIFGLHLAMYVLCELAATSKIGGSCANSSSARRSTPATLRRSTDCRLTKTPRRGYALWAIVTPPAGCPYTADAPERYEQEHVWGNARADVERRAKEIGRKALNAISSGSCI
ncbi:hypothetical protein DFH09DRAFT_1315770 [Mycena vulgaris]|nr:hypothetical protein DFH09DRAFT_1315770 [Mycena vulgaris]